MWRNFVRTFERSLTIAPKCCLRSSAKWNNQLRQVDCGQRSLLTSCLLRNTDVLTADPVLVNERDAEYIVPYKAEFEKAISAKSLIEVLSIRFRLKDKDIQQILSHEVVTKPYKKKSLILTLEYLALEGVTKKNFVEYPWLLTLENSHVKEKINLFRSLKGFRDINDFVPFLRLPLQRVRKIVSIMNRESKNVSSGNRVYYLAEKLGLPASLVTKYLSKRLFILEMPLEMFKTNLQLMIDYNVEPINLLKDLWAFRYAPRAVQLRLQRANMAKKDKIMPWMVRCPEPILQKSLQLSLDELKVLGKNSTVAEYVGERLGFSAEDAEAIMNKHPQVKSVRVTKIKEVLDYLLDEEKFSRYEIAQAPRILCHSLETTKQRIDELKKHGCRPSTLVIVCRSKREYEKFLNSWVEKCNLNESVSKAAETNKEGSS